MSVEPQQSVDSDVGSDRVRVNLWVPRAMYQFLEKTAERDCRSMSDIVREALRDYIVKDRRDQQGG